MRAMIPVLAALLWLPGLAAQTQTLHLVGGAKLKGRVLEQTTDEVKFEVALETGSAVLNVARARIVEVADDNTLVHGLASARAMLAMKDYHKAEEAARALLRLDPMHSGARMALADSLYGQFRVEEATRTLDHYLQLVPVARDPELLLQLAQYYLEAQNYRDARKLAREAADLLPENKDLHARVEEFLKRMDRVRTGSEQLREREAAERALVRQRREQRAEFDRNMGNLRDAQEAVILLTAWTQVSATRLLAGMKLELTAPDEAIASYQYGGEATELQGRVTRAALTVRVDEASWTGMFDHQKAMYLNGWYFQLRARYTRAYPTISVVCTVREGGQEKDKLLARASWDGRKEQVVIDRTTKENRDPTRPIRRLVR